MIDVDPEKAYYGYGHVYQADQELAVDTLLVTDDLFRSSDVLMRKKYVALVESVKQHGGTVFIFSSLHVSGKQLTQVSGVAAILRFALHLDSIDEDHATSDNHQDFDDGEVIEPCENENEEGDDEINETTRVRQDLEDMGL
jgi:protein pelota